jgi:hypothetical protein
MNSNYISKVINGEHYLYSLFFTRFNKTHNNIIKDIEKLFNFYNESINIEYLSSPPIIMSSYKDLNGKTNKCHLLSRLASLDLASGYSLDIRHNINKCWLEVDNENKESKHKVFDNIFLKSKICNNNKDYKKIYVLRNENWLYKIDIANDCRKIEEDFGVLMFESDYYENIEKYEKLVCNILYRFRTKDGLYKCELEEILNVIRYVIDIMEDKN